jgi:hypothetical protein
MMAGNATYDRRSRGKNSTVQVPWTLPRTPSSFCQIKLMIHRLIECCFDRIEIRHMHQVQVRACMHACIYMYTYTNIHTLACMHAYILNVRKYMLSLSSLSLSLSLTHTHTNTHTYTHDYLLNLWHTSYSSKTN